VKQNVRLNLCMFRCLCVCVMTPLKHLKITNINVHLVSVRASIIDKCSNPTEKENSRVSEVGSPHIDFPTP
jgi:hypothetical protein